MIPTFRGPGYFPSTNNQDGARSVARREFEMQMAEETVSDWEILSEELQLHALSFLREPRDRAAFVLTSRAAAGWLAPDDGALAFWRDPLFRIAMRKRHGSRHCARCLSMAPPWRLRMAILDPGYYYDSEYDIRGIYTCANRSQRRSGGACQCAEAVDKLVARQYIDKHLPTDLDLYHFNTLADMDAQLKREEFGDGSSEFSLRVGGPVLRVEEPKEHVYIRMSCAGREEPHVVRWPADAAVPSAARWLRVPSTELKMPNQIQCSSCKLNFVISLATAPTHLEQVGHG